MKRFVRVLTVVVVLLLAVSLSGCGELNDARVRLEGMLDTLKEGNYTQALDEYVCEKEENKDFLGCGENFNLDAYPAYDAQKALFESIDYKVLSSEAVKGGNIMFNVEITTLDLQPVADRLVELSETFEYNYMEEKGEELSEEELQESIDKAILNEQLAIINSYLASEDKATRTSTVKVEMCHKDKGEPWKVHLNDEFINALAGGLYTKYGPILEQ